MLNHNLSSLMRSCLALLKIAFSIVFMVFGSAGPDLFNNTTFRVRASSDGSCMYTVARYSVLAPGGFPQPVVITPENGSTPSSGKKFKTSREAFQIYLLTFRIVSELPSFDKRSNIPTPLPSVIRGFYIKFSNFLRRVF